MTTQPGLLQDATPDALLQVYEDDQDLPESRRRWAPLLADLLQVLEAVNVRQGKDADQAFAEAAQAVTAIADYFGGRPVYIPRGDRLRQALRDGEIWRRHKGGNIEALAAEYRITTVSVYEIIREQRALHTRKIQGRLFEDQGGNL